MKNVVGCLNMLKEPEAESNVAKFVRDRALSGYNHNINSNRDELYLRLSLYSSISKYLYQGVNIEDEKAHEVVFKRSKDLLKLGLSQQLLSDLLDRGVNDNKGYFTEIIRETIGMTR